MEPIAVTDFRVGIDSWLPRDVSDPLEGQAHAELRIEAGGVLISEIEDILEEAVRPCFRASAYRLAAWFVANWWRLRWESRSDSVDWWLSHGMASAGGGYVWPDATFESDGEYVLLHSKPTTDRTVSPILYLRQASINIPASVFEKAIDSFVDVVLARLASVGETNSDLAQAVAELNGERGDREVTERRKLEALLGCDAGEAEDALLDALTAAQADVGAGAVEEVAAASQRAALHVLNGIREQLKRTDLAASRDAIERVAQRAKHGGPLAGLPWQRAHHMARLARQEWGLGRGIVQDKVLAGLLELPESALRRAAAGKSAMSAGMRKSSERELGIVFRSPIRENRRFELMRIIGDDLIAVASERILPATRKYTARQKFQRAFAQEVLLPEAELLETLGNQPADDDAIDEIAHQYQVSSMVVRTMLVNARRLPVDELAA